MIIQWRKHETFLGLILLLETIGSIYVRDKGMSDELIKTVYASPFTERGLTFSYLRNILLPELIFAVTLFSIQILFNSFVVHKLLTNRQLKKGVLQLVSLLLFLLISSIATNFLLHEYEFVSGSAQYKYLNLLIIPSIKLFGIVTVFFLAYVILRETVIYSVSKRKDANYSIHILNRVSFMAAAYFSIIGMLFFFKINMSSGLMISVVLLLPVLLLTGLSLVFRVFPIHSIKGFFSRPNFTALFANIILLSVPFGVFFSISMHGNGDLLKFFFVTWFCQFFVATPISWWIFQWQKKHLEQLRGIELTLDQTNAEFALLRSQVNPHFLFNSLNTLYGTALEEKALKTATAIQLLGDMMRYLTDQTGVNKIPLSKEIDYLNNFIKLQLLRFKDNKFLKFDYQEKLEGADRLTEPMLLIPLVENAFKHGISNTQPCYIKISLVCERDRISLEVNNSVIKVKGQDPENDRHGIGLINLQRRLEILYPGKHQLKTQKSDNSFTAQLQITFI